MSSHDSNTEEQGESERLAIWMSPDLGLRLDRRC